MGNIWLYIVKRLLIAVPTLLGIAVITFAFIRLAPGDPFGMEEITDPSLSYHGAVSVDVSERTRKLYGLDKPILLNFDVMDRGRTVEAAWERLAVCLEKESREEELARAQEELVSLGSRIVPPLVPLVIDEGNEAKARALGTMLRLAGLTDEAADLESLEAWWGRECRVFGQASIRQAVDHVISGSRPEQESAIDLIRGRLRSRALPHARGRIDKTEPGEARERLALLMAQVAGCVAAGGEEGKIVRPRAKESPEALLCAWWKENSLTHRDIGWLERAGRCFTEAQFPLWLSRIATLDFGESYRDHRPVFEKVWESMKITLSFQIISIFLIYLIAVPLGVLSAVRKGTLSDTCITIGLFMFYSLPGFWVATMLIVFLSGTVCWDIFPPGGLSSADASTMTGFQWLLDRAWHMVLPLVCLTYGGLASLSRYTRAGMVEVIRQDYIRTARAKGLPEWKVIAKHAFRNGLIPLITLFAGLLPALISGAVIVETIFGIHGLGLLGYQAVLDRDYPVIMAISFLTAFLVLLGMILSDVLYMIFDPRITLERN